MTGEHPRGKFNIRATALAIGLPLAAAGIGSLGGRRAPEVYARLDKPAWAPPAAVFGPVWTVLYAGLGAVGWRMSRRDAPARTWVLHGTQLALNAIWPLTFFGLRDKRASLTVIVALDALVAAELVDLAGNDPVAAGVLSPYLGWCLFATALNASVSDPAD